MGTTHFCQSCSMPLTDKSMMGTEKDGSVNKEYCKYCYMEGALVNPDMTLDQMTALVIGKMEDMEIPADIIETAVKRLPDLKRWKKVATTA